MSPTANHPPLRFSVVTCCYNQGAYLKDNIEAVLKQDYPDFEHIVVDDGSTDNTREVCAAYPHVRYVHQQNAGQSAALNRGFDEATGDLIAWVNSDDYHEPGAFKTVAETFAKADEKVLVGGEAHVVDAEGAFLWKLRNGRVPFYRLLAHPLLYRNQGRTVMPCQPSVFFRRSLVQDIGLLRTDLKYGMDYEYWLRALRAGYRFIHVPQVFSNYRYHATSHTVELGYDIFLDEWKETARSYRAQLTSLQRGRAATTELLFLGESILYRRHRQGEKLLAQRRALKDPTATRRAALLLLALINAPWLLPRMVRNRFSRRE